MPMIKGNVTVRIRPALCSSVVRAPNSEPEGQGLEPHQERQTFFVRNDTWHTGSCEEAVSRSQRKEDSTGEHSNTG